MKRLPTLAGAGFFNAPMTTIVILLSLYTVSAQELSWATQVGSKGRDYLHYMVAGKNGIYVAGTLRKNVSLGGDSLEVDGFDDMMVARMDLNGNIVWAKNYGGSNDDAVSGMVQDENGNLYIIDNFRGNTTINTISGDVSFNNYSGNWYTLLIKIDKDGKLQWAAPVPTDGSDSVNSNTGRAICLKGGKVYITGAYRGIINNGTDTISARFTEDVSYHFGTYLARFSDNGNLEWISDLASNGGGRAIDVDDKGNIYLSGSFSKNTKIGQPGKEVAFTGADFNSYYCKLDNDGEVQWARTIQGNAWIDNIHCDKNGSLYMTGSFNDTIIIGQRGNSHMLTTKQINAAYICRIDGSGRSLWARPIDQKGTPFSFYDPEKDKLYVYTYATTLKYNSDCEVIWKKNLQGDVLYGSLAVYDGFVYVNALLTGTVTIDVNGVDQEFTVDRKIMQQDALILAYEECPGFAVDLTSSGDSVLTADAGKEKITTYRWFMNNEVIPDADSIAYIPTHNGEYYVVAVNKIGCESVSDKVRVSGFSGIGPNVKDPVQLTAYPNPALGILNIRYELPQAAQVSISLYDISGRRVWNQPLGRQMQGMQYNSIPVTNLTNGLYILEVNAGPEGVSRTRIGIRK